MNIECETPTLEGSQQDSVSTATPPLASPTGAATGWTRSRVMALLGGFTFALVLGACAQNPVTGKRDLLLVSEDWELAVGRQQYAPLRQAQGGDYVVDPGVEAYVRSVGNRLAAQSDRKLPYEFNVINDSTPNAWALPGGKISINRGLLVELSNEAELAAVLGHEIVHAAAKHGARGQTRGIGLQLAVMTATIAGANKGYGQLAQLGSTIGAQIINSKYGRGAELESDRFGMEYMSRAGYNPRGAVELQQTFVRLSEGRKSDWLTGLFASHPPSQDRVAKNIQTAAALPAGGDVGADRYRRAMSRLIDKREAYQKFDRAQKLAAEGNRSEARALAQQAIRIEPREGHFQSFLGDLALQGNDFRTAERHYDRAISLNDQFFYYYLQRGKANEGARDVAAARADYARSVKLMPTADAQAGLGAIAQARGNDAEAKRWYAQAAQASGPSGERARAALAKLEPPADSRSLVLARRGVTPGGNLAFEIVNQSAQTIRNVRLAVRQSASGSVQETVIRDVIPAGGRKVIDTQQPVTRQQLSRISVSVLGAEATGRR